MEPRIMKSVPILALPLVLLAACAQEGAERISRGSLTSISRIDREPSRYYDRAVTIRGVVLCVWSPGTFTVGTGEGHEILVVSPAFSPALFPVKKGQFVQAQGTVRRLEPGELGAASGLAFGDAPPPAGSLPVPLSWMGRPVVVAGPIEKLSVDPRDCWTYWPRPAALSDAY
jgi:hypothetical protein